MDTALFQVGELAKKVGVSTKTVGFYEQKGFLKPSAHTTSGMRLYSLREVNRLMYLKRLRVLGLSIKEIDKVISGEPKPKNRKDIIDRTLKLLLLQKACGRLHQK